MIVRVLFFGATADIAGRRESEIELSDGAKVESITSLVLKQHPGLDKHKLLISVNQEYANAGKPLRDGDELAIFTAVSGG